MTAEVAEDRPDFVGYPGICACAAAGFDKGIDSEETRIYTQ